jgi:two-component system nitrogen regulation response regulator GlnG
MRDEDGASGESTLDGHSGSGGLAAQFRDLTLTILCHPDPRRIGERARAFPVGQKGRLELHRGAPSFHAGARETGPLADRFLSRRPIAIASDGRGTIHIVPHHDGSKLEVDEEPVVESLRLPLAALSAGVVLELAGRVTLLLHTLGPPLPPRPRLDMVGDSEVMEDLRGRALQVAALSAPVLIRGETGVGKELVAAAIHRHSPRAQGPLVSVNAASLSATTALSELFGHRRGAFTDAHSDHDGAFARAHGGTLFLDEIGELPGAVQAMLLRAIETMEIQPLGAREPRRVDVRVLAATDADLEVAVAQREFRGPLFHRLAGYQIHVPPLRSRRDDIARLLIHFLRQEGTAWKIAPPGPDSPGWVSASLMARCARYGWPGNARELRNAVRALLLATSGRLPLTLDETAAAILSDAAWPVTPPALQSPVPGSAPVLGSGPGSGPVIDRAPALPRRRVRPEDANLVDVLRRHGWSTSAAAAELGISRTSLYAWIDQSKDIRKAADVGREELERALAQCEGDVERAAALLEVSPRGLKLRLRQLRD